MQQMMQRILPGAVLVALGGLLAAASLVAHTGGPGTAGDAGTADDPVQRGRYLVTIGGCNDCHTPGYMAATGDVPEERWLSGNSLGFSGPWGTTYPGNLRRLLGTMDEDTWVRFAKTLRTRPPMPWFNLRAMAEEDLRAVHRYVRSLPADDSPVPDYVPPRRQPATPHILMTPQTPKHNDPSD